MIDFTLPDTLIAQQPVHPRDSARLLVYNRSRKEIIDSVFSELPRFLAPDTTVVMNNAKVDHCRWLFEKNMELFVLEKLDTYTVRALVRPGRKFKRNAHVQLTDWLAADVVAIDEHGIRTIRLDTPHDDARLLAYEHVPLPPYIAQNDTLANEYQTVYARQSGSKAAPTAGLHFTKSLLKHIAQSHPMAEITLHVGLGTFAPLTETQLASGRLHEESYEITTATMPLLRSATHRTAIGTTTVRTLESLTDFNAVSAFDTTDILISPGYVFKHVDSMVTNFHLPGTSLLLLVEAFVGSERELKRIYDHATAQRYRFYSFGDAMLIL